MHNVECYSYDLFERFGNTQAVPIRFYARKLDDKVLL